MVLTDRHLRELASFSRTFHTDIPAEHLDPKVLEMHTANDLWATVQLVRDKAHHLDLEMRRKLDQMVPGTQHIPLAGSGVQHFDRDFIVRDWPLFNQRLTYWSLDIGVVRRFSELAGVLYAYEGDRRHRALPDAYSALEQARHYVQVLGREP